MQTGANIYSTISISGEKELDLSGFQPWLGCQYEPETRTKAFVDQSIEFALTEFFASESGQDPIVLDEEKTSSVAFPESSRIASKKLVLGDSMGNGFG